MITIQAGRGLRQECYRIVYADPPWSYRDKAAAGKRGASLKYGCLSVEDIGTFEIDGSSVAQIASLNSALFLWSTGPMMDEARRVMGAWDFTDKNIAFTWVIQTKNGKLF